MLLWSFSTLILKFVFSKFLNFPILCQCQIGYTNVKHVFEDVYKLIKASFDEHKESFQEDQLRDYMDVYIKEMNSAEKVISKDCLHRRD